MCWNVIMNLKIPLRSITFGLFFFDFKFSQSMTLKSIISIVEMASRFCTQVGRRACANISRVCSSLSLSLCVPFCDVHNRNDARRLISRLLLGNTKKNGIWESRTRGVCVCERAPVSTSPPRFSNKRNFVCKLNMTHFKSINDMGDWPVGQLACRAPIVTTVDSCFSSNERERKRERGDILAAARKQEMRLNNWIWQYHKRRNNLVNCGVSFAKQGLPNKTTSTYLCISVYTSFGYYKTNCYSPALVFLAKQVKNCWGGRKNFDLKERRETFGNSCEVLASWQSQTSNNKNES